MPRLLLILMISTALWIAGGPIAVAAEKAATMDAITVPVGRLALAPPVGFRSQRSAVSFPHSLHFEYTCSTCHHTWDGRSSVQGCSASACHDQQTAPPPAKGTRYRDYIRDSIAYFKFAFHRKCIGCHKEIKARNARMAPSVFMGNTSLPKTGPTGCVGCHPRE